jgi:hypothetical protein
VRLVELGLKTQSLQVVPQCFLDVDIFVGQPKMVLAPLLKKRLRLRQVLRRQGRRQHNGYHNKTDRNSP